MVDWSVSEQWGWFLAVLALFVAAVIGLEFGASLRGSFAALVFGAFLCRYGFRLRRNLKVPVMLVLGGAFIGLLVGTFFDGVFLLSISLAAGYLGGYALHSNGVIESVDI